jgi:hypothetical protein
MSDVELVQVVVSVDGALCPGFQNARTLKVVRLPVTVGLMPLHDLIQSES